MTMLEYLICRKQADFDAEAIEAFDSFLTRSLKTETDLLHNLAHPKHMFLSCVTDCAQLLVHSSATLDIDILKPIRHSSDVETTGYESHLLWKQ